MANQGLGILLPLERGNTGYFNQGFSVLEQAKSNLINLILTKKGERVMQPDFGCDIHRIIFDPMTPDMSANVKGTIIAAAKIWMPSVTIIDVQVTQNIDLNQAYAKVSFNVISNPANVDTVTVKF